MEFKNQIRYQGNLGETILDDYRDAYEENRFVMFLYYREFQGRFDRIERQEKRSQYS